jgi:hypothetical protein
MANAAARLPTSAIESGGTTSLMTRCDPAAATTGAAVAKGRGRDPRLTATLGQPAVRAAVGFVTNLSAVAGACGDPGAASPALNARSACCALLLRRSQFCGRFIGCLRRLNRGAALPHPFGCASLRPGPGQPYVVAPALRPLLSRNALYATGGGARLAAPYRLPLIHSFAGARRALLARFAALFVPSLAGLAALVPLSRARLAALFTDPGALLDHVLARLQAIVTSLVTRLQNVLAPVLGKLAAVT